MMNSTEKVWQRGEKLWQLSFLHVYPITMFLGFVIAFLSVAYFWKRMKYSWEILQVLLIIIVPCSLIGARFWFLISEGGWDHWYKLEGLSIQGGITGSAIPGIIYVWTKRSLVDVRTCIGIIIPCVVIGQAIGRWGNFANHEVYGRVVDGNSLNWLTFIKPQMLISDSTSTRAYRAPLFFYESMMNLIGYLLIVWVLLRKNWLKPGVTAALYFIWYGITRSVMEPLRDPADIMRINGAPVSQYIAILWILLGIGLFIWWQLLAKPVDSITKKIVSPNFLKLFKKEYKVIYPIKPRRIFFFGEKVEYKRKYFIYWGPKVENRVKLYLPKDNNVKLSKREINQSFNSK